MRARILIRICVLAAVLLSRPASCQTVLKDNFDGTSLNLSVWTPTGVSYVVSEGRLRARASFGGIFPTNGFKAGTIAANIAIPAEADFYAEVAFDWIPNSDYVGGAWFSFGFDGWPNVFIENTVALDAVPDSAMGIGYVNTAPIAYGYTSGARALKFVIRRDAGMVSFGWGEDGDTKSTMPLSLPISEVILTYCEYKEGDGIEHWRGQVNIDSVYVSTGSATTVQQDTTTTVFDRVAVAQNFPNPFNSETEIQVHIGFAGPIQVCIFNTLGQIMRTMVRRADGPGSYSFTWDGADQSGTHVPSGLYLYRVTASGIQQTRKMVLLK